MRLIIPLSLFIVTSVRAQICHFPGPAFPIPEITSSNPIIQSLGEKLTSELNNASKEKWLANITSYSIALTSKEEAIWSSHHTADILGNYTGPKLKEVTGDSVYRLASVSKTFAVLTALLEKGIRLHDPVTKYIPELRQCNNTGGTKWEDITIQDLGSQLSGISRNSDIGDLSVVLPTIFSDPRSIGFPKLDPVDIPTCSVTEKTRLCTRKEILDALIRRPPLFAPGDRQQYSNAAITLLGLVVEKVTGKPWGSVLQEKILSKLDMKRTGTKKPEDASGVIPAIPDNQWAIDLGFDTPSGGVYSTTNDLSKFLRAILNRRLLSDSATRRWLKPLALGYGLRDAVGMPWEIMRFDKLTPDGRVIDLYTKAGGIVGYATYIIIIPEYSVGLTILTAGDSRALNGIVDTVIPPIVEALEKIAREEAKSYAGTYRAVNGINSTITFELDDGPGLKISSMISNSTDIIKLSGGFSDSEPSRKPAWRTSPSSVRRDGGSSWRIVMGLERSSEKQGSLTSSLCAADTDVFTYGRQSLHEIIFKGSPSNRRLALPGLRVEMSKVGGTNSTELEK